MAIQVISVPAQTDKDYSSISSNQCSWAAYEFVKNSSKLQLALYNKRYDEFLSTYKDCLKTASELRKDTSGCLYGENIDTPSLREHYASSIRITSSNGIYKNEDDEFNSFFLNLSAISRLFSVSFMTASAWESGVGWSQRTSDFDF